MSAPKAQLRAVEAGETPAPKVRKTVAEAAESGSHLELLISIRDRLAKAISSDCPPRDLSSLTRRLTDVAAEIKTLREAEGDDHDHGDTPDTFDASAI